MTSSSNSRLDRIEAILENNADQIVELRKAQERTQDIVNSNSRAIEAWESRFDDTLAAAEEIASAFGVSAAQRQQEDRERFDKLHTEHSQRFYTLLEEARADRQKSEANQQEWDQRFDQRQQEWNQRFDQRQQEWNERFDQQQREWNRRFDEAIAANTAEHNAFRQNIQVLLAEIARLWQRLAG